MVKEVALAAFLLGVTASCNAQEQVVRCMSPVNAALTFEHRGFTKTTPVGNVLLFTSPQEAVYYYVPPGSVCVVTKENNYKQEERSDLQGNTDTDAAGDGWGRVPRPEVRPGDQREYR